MSHELNFADWVRPARRRAAADAVLVWSPLVLVCAALGWRYGGIGPAAGILLAGGIALAVAARLLATRLDRGWLVRRLNAREARLEDSAALLFATPQLAPFERLQADRIAARIDAVDPASLADNWSRRGIAAAWALGTIALAATILWPDPAPAPPPLTRSGPSEGRTPGDPHLTGYRLRVVPPAYTRLHARYVQSLDVRAPQGSRIEWTFAFAPLAKAAGLQLVGGQSVPLSLGGGGWEGSLRLDVPSLYHVTAEGNQVTRAPHRLEPIADEPPQVQVIEPTSGLVMIRPGQRRWRVVFEASDDYAVDPLARLTLTTAIGEGENVSFTERSRTVSGTVTGMGAGDPRRRRFVIDLDLGSSGLQPGSDLVAQLTVADTRSPGPQVVRGPGVILRWPAPVPPSPEGLELMAKQTMPAYFRSQRQIIIDTGALIKQRGKIGADDFLVRSDTIGVDQRLLRLRYGQFVGMEAEEAPRRPPMPIADKDGPAAPETEHHDGDGHDHGAAPEAPVFGGLGNITAEYGHRHDESEAATMLDPGTRALLKSALDAMWDTELHLRSGQPEKALPFELKALDFIKKVQQASRIYLPRIGTVQPPIDMARRMTGKRAGIIAKGAVLTPFAIEDAVPATAWRALSGPGAIDLDGLGRWVRSNSGRIRDPLAVLAAIDRLRADPGSRALREKLRGALWIVLTRPPAQVRRRDDGGAVGRRYTQGLR